MVPRPKKEKKELSNLTALASAMLSDLFVKVQQLKKELPGTYGAIENSQSIVFVNGPRKKEHGLLAILGFSWPTHDDTGLKTQTGLLGDCERSKRDEESFTTRVM